MSWLANDASSKAGSTERLRDQLIWQMAPYVSMTLPEPIVIDFKEYKIDSPLPNITQLVGDWTLEWGPVVVEKKKTERGAGTDYPTDVADNAMFVASTTDLGDGAPEGKKIYVVAIAGTNGVSFFDWVIEDFEVQVGVDWNTFDPYKPDEKAKYPFPPVTDPKIETATTPIISMGTAIGVGNLLRMVPSGPAVGRGDLMTFLQGLPDKDDAVVITTGHSLGGALSPTMALWIEQQLGQSSSAATKFKEVAAYPTAGPTPGNGEFAKLFDGKLPHKGDWFGYKAWNTNIWNDIDVVPHAWSLERMPFIPFLYGNTNLPGNHAPSDILLAVGAATYRSFNSALGYHDLHNHKLDGKVNPKAAAVPPKTFDEFMLQLLYQHVDAYVDGLILPANTSFPKPDPALNPPQLPGVNVVDKKDVLKIAEQYIEYLIRLQ